MKPSLNQLCSALLTPAVGTKVRVLSSVTEIRRALVILWQHNHLIYQVSSEVVDYTNLSESYKKKGLLYSLNLDSILNCLRVPQLLLRCSRTHGPLASLLLEEIALHGRLSLRSLIAQATTRLNRLMQSIIDEVSAIGLESSDRTDTSEENKISYQPINLTPELVQLQHIYSKGNEAVQKDLRSAFAQLARKRLLVNAETVTAEMEQTLAERRHKEATAASEVRGAAKSFGAIFRSNVVSPAAGTASKAVSIATKPTPANTPVTGRSNRRKRSVGQPLSNNLPVELSHLSGQRENISNSPTDMPQMLANALDAAAADVAAETVVDLYTPPLKSARLETTAASSGRGRGGRGTAKTTKTITSSAATSNATSNASAVDNIYHSTTNTNYQDRFQDHESLANLDSWWIVGWDRHFADEGRRLCLRLVEERWGSLAGQAIAALLSLDRGGEQGFSVGEIVARMKEGKCDKYSSTEEEIIGSSSGNGTNIVSPVSLQSLLDLIRLDPMNLVSAKGTVGQYLYTARPQSAVVWLQERTIHDSVVDRRGQLAVSSVLMLYCVPYNPIYSAPAIFFY